MNKLIVSTSLALGAALAQAQTTPPASAPEAAAAAPAASPFSANINLTTKYKFRGQDQGNTNWFSPALQGGFDWSQNGFYIGNWNSNVNFSNAAIEMDFYGGYKGDITKDFAYDVGILQYYYPQKNKVIDFNVTEIYGALTYSVVTVKYSHTVSSDYFGNGEIQQMTASLGGAGISRPKGRNTGYLEAAANFPLVDKLTLNTHIGYTRYASDLRNARYSVGATTTGVGIPNFYDYKIGVTYDLSAPLGSGVSAAAAVVGASKRGFYKDYVGADVNQTRVILTLSKSM